MAQLEHRSDITRQLGHGSDVPRGKKTSIFINNVIYSMDLIFFCEKRKRDSRENLGSENVEKN